MADDTWFDHVVDAGGDWTEEAAPARLKSRVYSALLNRLAETGPLMDLRGSKETGGRLCVFESAVAMLPVGTDIRSKNPCRVCHARVLGETMEHAPIFWPGCPYSEFHNG